MRTNDLKNCGVPKERLIKILEPENKMISKPFCTFEKTTCISKSFYLYGFIKYPSGVWVDYISENKSAYFNWAIAGKENLFDNEELLCYNKFRRVNLTKFVIFELNIHVFWIKINIWQNRRKPVTQSKEAKVF